MKETLIILMGSTWLQIHQASSKKLTQLEHDEKKIPELTDKDTSMNGEINAEHYI